MHSDVIVIGAGLVGLAVADELARRGRRVCVLDRQPETLSASWASAGMLMPVPVLAWNAAFEAMCLNSFFRFPAFVDDLFNRTGIDCELRMEGVLVVAEDDAGARCLSERVEDLRREGHDTQWCNEADIKAREPWLAAAHQGGMWLSQAGQVNSRLLLTAMELACVQRGVQISRHRGAVRVAVEGGSVRGVETAHEYVSAPTVVNAAGAWAAALQGVPVEARVPVHPVKGQMLALRVDPTLLKGLTWTDGAYLVPGRDGRLLVGSTLEPEAQFDREVTAGAVERLLAAVIKQLPRAADSALTETWAGLRPGTHDGLPYLGGTPVEGYVVACGHYRNGILLTPVTAAKICDWIDGRADAVEPAFALGRCPKT